jgi:hypothetical protein
MLRGEKAAEFAGEAPSQARLLDRIAGGGSLHGKERVDGSSQSEGSKDVIPICLTAVSSGNDDAAAAVEVFRGRLQEEGGHARA